MSKEDPHTPEEAGQPATIGDLLALKLQQLHSEEKLSGDQPLLRIDNRDEAARAPFQFDAARSRLHRTGCPAIPPSSESALFGLWRFLPEEGEYACPRCKPVPETEETADSHFTTDILYGVMSIIDQFGNVLRERGREYRSANTGRRAEQEVKTLYANLMGREKEVLDVLLSSLDVALKTVRELDRPAADQPGGGATGDDD